MFSDGTIGTTKIVAGFDSDISVNLANGGDCGVSVTTSGGYVCSPPITGTYIGIISDGNPSAATTEWAMEFLTGDASYLAEYGVG